MVNGAPLSIRNNNPGNLRPVGASDGFQRYGTPQEGLDAMRNDLLLKISGKSGAMSERFGEQYQPTLQNLVSTWAPPSENDTSNYIKFVSEKTGINANSVLKPEDVDKIMPAMIEMEGGAPAVEHFAGGVIEIEAPDGTILEFPDTMSEEDILQVMRREYPPTTQPAPVTTLATEAPAEVATTPEDQNFLQRLGADFSKRNDMANEIKDAHAAGEQSVPESALQAFLNVGVGTMSDVVGEGLVSGARGLSAITPDFIEEPVKAGAASALKQVGKLPAFGGGTLASEIPGEVQMLSEKGSEFAEEHPRAARNLQALGNAAQFVPGVKAASSVDDIARQGLKKADDLLAKMPKLPAKQGLMPSDDAFKHSRKFYTAADDVGAHVPEERAFKLFDDMQSRTLPKDPKDLKSASREAYYRTLKEIEDDYLGEPLSLQNLINIDQKLTGDIQKMAVSDPAGARKLGLAQNVVREFMDDPLDGDITGGKLGFELYREGTRSYSKAKRMETIENIVAHAEGAAQPSTAIKNGLRTLRKRIREKKVRGYTDAEIKMIDKAIATGVVEGVLRGAGSRLVPHAASLLAVGSLGLNPVAMAGSAALYGGSALSRMGAKAIKTGKTNKLLKSIQPDANKTPSALMKLYETTPKQ